MKRDFPNQWKLLKVLPHYNGQKASMNQKLQTCMPSIINQKSAREGNNYINSEIYG